MEQHDHALIVDDDSEIRNLLAEYLGRQGFRVSLARDGREMRQALQASRPDIVVLDIMLPGEDGLALCRDLRAKSNIPVIMLTARGEELDRIIGIEMGADDYLGKPFSPRELLARMKGVLRRARRGPPPALRRLDARPRGAPPRRARRRGGAARRHRVPPAVCVRRASKPRARPQPADGPHPGPRCDAARPLDRRAGEPAAPAPARRRARAAHHQDGAQRRLRARGDGRAARLMRLVPGSLFGRTMLVLGAGLLLAQLATMLINVMDRGGAVYRLASEQVAIRIAEAAKLLNRVPAADRAWVLEELNNRDLRILLSAKPIVVPQGPDELNHYERPFAASVQRYIGAPWPTDVEITARLRSVRPSPEDSEASTPFGRWFARNFYFLLPDTLTLVTQIRLQDGSTA